MAILCKRDRLFFWVLEIKGERVEKVISGQQSAKDKEKAKRAVLGVRREEEKTG